MREGVRGGCSVEGADVVWNSSMAVSFFRGRTYIGPSSYNHYVSLSIPDIFRLVQHGARLTRASILGEDLLDFRHVSFLKLQ
jgi:hypothetical protein